MGFATATPVQTQAIPVILEGSDVLGQAATGTGKTAAFGVPTIELVDAGLRKVQSLMLCPTRELAVQVCDELRKIARYKGLNIVPIYGGESIERQLRQLADGVHIVVGTPGRVMDHMERGSLVLDNVIMVVLDEADEMLNMGFRDDIEYILSRITQAHQTLLFSATMSREIMGIAKRYQFEPKIIKTTNTANMTAPLIKQSYYFVKPRTKVEVVARIMEYHELERVIVFTNTKRMADELAEQLVSKGISAEALHGDMQQNRRNLVMGKFRRSQTKVLIATDVAARGIDVSDIEAVINYDVPVDEEFYVHRIGRTGRNGKTGKSFTLASDRDIQQLRQIMKFTGSPIEEESIPTLAEITEMRTKNFVAQVVESAPTIEANDYADVVFRLSESGLTQDQIILALLAKTIGPVKAADQAEDPLFSRGGRFERGDRPERAERGDRNDRFRSERNDRGDRNGRKDRDFSRNPREAYKPKARGEFSNSLDRFDRSGADGASRPSRPERVEGAERPARKPREERVYDSPMARLWVSIGRQDRVRPGDLVGAIAGEANISGSSIGAIDIFDKFSFVDVPADSADSVIAAMDNNMIRRKRVNVSLATATENA